MVVEKNFKYLLELNSDIQKQVADSPAFAVFNKDKIDAFYTANDEALTVAAKEVKALLDEHVVKDREGKPEDYEVNGKRSWVFLSKDDRMEFNRKYELLIERPVKIHL